MAPQAKRGKTLFSFFRKRDDEVHEDDNHSTPNIASEKNVETSLPNLEPHLQSQVTE